MNNDLISREALRKAFRERIYYFNKSSWDEANALIDNAPTVEAFTKDDMAGAYNEGYMCGSREAEKARPQGEWGKWVITEIQCPNCFEYFETDCYSTEELQKCPNCGADMRTKENNNG